MAWFPAGVPRAKRLLDLVLTLVGLIVISPLILVVAIWIWVKLGKPILFRQIRPGYRGQPFMLYKFRTMTDERDSKGDLLPDEKRLTTVGRFLRATSLDELPSLLNVIRGEMSLVGPRPLLMEYLERYTSEQAHRHDVLPGITGWAQIHGRNVLSWEDKFRLDVWYVDNWSIRLDLNILVKTLWKVLQREGISHPGHVTSPVFMGGDDESAGDGRGDKPI
jgi:lipopolysaccharide/colanic/teichoic acid biosynthesis glycosyltransferase